MYVLIPLKDRIDNLEGENNNRYNLVQKALQDADKAVTNMEEYNSQGATDKTKWAYIQMEYGFAHDRSSNLAEEYKNTSDEIIKLTYELAEKCQQIAQEAEELEIPIIKAIRKELSFPFDERAYREMLEMSNREWEEKLQEYIASKKILYKEIVNKFESMKEPPIPNP